MEKTSINSLATYTLRHFVTKAANSNVAPVQTIFRKYVKIGLLIAPFIMWLMWAY